MERGQKLLVNFETPIADASVFFDKWVKEILGNEFNIEEKDIPTFYAHAYDAKFIIDNADAETVARALRDDLIEIVQIRKNGNVIYETNGCVYYSPDEKDNYPIAFVVHGTKQIEVDGHYWVAGMRVSAHDQLPEYIPEMFFIRVIQGGENITQLKFDTDDRDVFILFGDVIIDLLKGQIFY